MLHSRFSLGLPLEFRIPVYVYYLTDVKKELEEGCFTAGSVLGFHLNSGSQMTPDCFLGVA